MPKQAGPDFILESNPDGPALTEKELKALAEKDELQAHIRMRAHVWWVEAKAGQRGVCWDARRLPTKALAGSVPSLPSWGLTENNNRHLYGSTCRRSRPHQTSTAESIIQRESLDSRFCFLQPTHSARGERLELRGWGTSTFDRSLARADQAEFQIPCLGHGNRSLPDVARDVEVTHLARAARRRC